LIRHLDPKMPPLRLFVVDRVGVLEEVEWVLLPVSVVVEEYLPRQVQTQKNSHPE